MLHDSDLTIVADGPCQVGGEDEGQSSEGRCPCPDINDPVCGSNGHTYSSKCALNCVAKGNPGMSEINLLLQLHVVNSAGFIPAMRSRITMCRQFEIVCFNF